MVAADIVTRASIFAATAHQGQKYGEQPYTVHLSRVVEILQEYGYTDPDVLAAGWLHDVIEDTAVDFYVLQEQFSRNIAMKVWACSGEGINRRERVTSIIGKLTDYPTAIPIKLADRIANVESCWATCDKRLFMYEREYPDFRRTCRASADPRARMMISHLDGLI